MKEPMDDRCGDLKSNFSHIEPELMEYYLGLRQALSQCRDSGATCWCDPRDQGMVAKLAETLWEPKVTLKLPGSKDEDQEGFTSKQTALDDDAVTNRGDDGAEKMCDKLKKSNVETFVCGVHGCNAIFTSIANYESHYYTSHNFCCSACKRSFVSNFLLDIHIEENHDSYFKALSSRVAMYRCLVENCSEKFQTEADRQNHLAQQHKYPHKFAFHRPIKSNPQLPQPLTPKETDHDTFTPSSVQSVMQTDDTDKPDLTQGSPSGRGGKGNRMPSKICFGRGSKRAFKKKSGKGQDYQWYRTGKMDVDTTVDIETIDFKDLSDSIPNIS